MPSVGPGRWLRELTLGLYFGEAKLSDRVAVFMDGAYLDWVLRGFGNPRVDRAKLSREITSNDNLLRTYYYDCPPYQSNPPTADESQRFARKQRFFDALKQKSNFEVREGHLLSKGTSQDGNPIFQQKGADILLAVDMLSLGSDSQIQKAYLIAGDGDFVPVVRAVKNKGVVVHLFHGRPPYGNYSQQLWDACDDRTEILQDLIDKSLM